MFKDKKETDKEIVTPSLKKDGEVYTIQERMDRMLEINKQKVLDELKTDKVSILIEPNLCWMDYKNCLLGLPQNATFEKVDEAGRLFDCKKISEAETLAVEKVSEAYLDWLNSQKDIFSHTFKLSDTGRFTIIVKNKDTITDKNIEAIKTWKPKN